MKSQPGLAALGFLIYRVRVDRGRRQIDVAKELDMSQSNYARIERGGVGLTVSQFLAVCRVLKIDAARMIRPFQ